MNPKKNSNLLPINLVGHEFDLCVFRLNLMFQIEKEINRQAIWIVALNTKLLFATQI